MAPLNDKDRADLVAFLDGELDKKTARDLEAKLTRDPQARAEVEALRKTWELLDYLPRPEPSLSFTHRTMERISALAPAAPGGKRRWPRWVIGLGWAAVLLLAAGIGFGTVRLLTPAGDGKTAQGPLAHLDPAEEERLLVHNLRLLENKRLYEHVDDMEFLKDLEEFFGESEGAN
jgi:hypothetical protein